MYWTAEFETEEQAKLATDVIRMKILRSRRAKASVRRNIDNVWHCGKIVIVETNRGYKPTKELLPCLEIKGTSAKPIALLTA